MYGSWSRGLLFIMVILLMRVRHQRTFSLDMTETFSMWIIVLHFAEWRSWNDLLVVRTTWQFIGTIFLWGRPQDLHQFTHLPLSINILKFIGQCERRHFFRFCNETEFTYISSIITLSPLSLDNWWLHLVILNALLFPY